MSSPKGIPYDAKALTASFLGGIKAGTWKNTEEFVRALQDANPDMKIVSGSIRSIASVNGWKESAEELLSEQQRVDTGDRVDRLTTQLYRDRERITRLRRKCLAQMEKAIKDPKDEDAKAFVDRAEKIVKALHTMETDVEKALQSPAVSDGQPTYQVTLIDETAQWANEAGAWTPEKALRGAVVAPVAEDGAGSSGKAQEGLGGPENPKDGSGAPVVAGDGAQKSVQGGGVVHGADLRVGKTDSVGAGERNVGQPAGAAQGR